MTPYPRPGLPELPLSPAAAITEKVNYRLLANTIAHQWWGVSVSPASRDDWWLSDGFARYSEARYVEQAAGEAGLEEVVKDMSVGALAYDTVPLSSAGKLDMFSPEFQSLVTDKGAMILHMLRWVRAIRNTIRPCALSPPSMPGNRPPSMISKRSAEQNYGEQLTWFFSQWLDSTGAPEFKDQVHHLPAGQRQGLSRRRADLPGPRSFPHAGRAENRYRRQDRGETHRSRGHGFAVQR